jgi:hypothetical protein
VRTRTVLLYGGVESTFGTPAALANHVGRCLSRGRRAAAFGLIQSIQRPLRIGKKKMSGWSVSQLCVGQKRSRATPFIMALLDSDRNHWLVWALPIVARAWDSPTSLRLTRSGETVLDRVPLCNGLSQRSLNSNNDTAIAERARVAPR